MQSLNNAIDAAARLASEDGENPEYDRALVELIVDTFGADLNDLDPTVMDDGMETARPYVANLIRQAQKRMRPLTIKDEDLRLVFTPDAIREHFDAACFDPTTDLSDTQLRLVGLVALTDDSLYAEFHRALIRALDQVAKEGGA